MAVAIASTAVREYVYFAPMTLIAVGEIVFLRQLGETIFIAVCGLPALSLVLFLARRVDVFMVRQAWLIAAASNFLMFPIGFFFLSALWGSYAVGAMWAFLLAVGGTVMHAVALLLADKQSVGGNP
ncbi:MAG: hypothetical protein ACQEW8_07225 [Actinomycetota bacterium]